MGLELSIIAGPIQNAVIVVEIPPAFDCDIHSDAPCSTTSITLSLLAAEKGNHLGSPIIGRLRLRLFGSQNLGWG